MKKFFISLICLMLGTNYIKTAETEGSSIFFDCSKYATYKAALNPKKDFFKLRADSTFGLSYSQQPKPLKDANLYEMFREHLKEEKKGVYDIKSPEKDLSGDEGIVLIYEEEATIFSAFSVKNNALGLVLQNGGYIRFEELVAGLSEDFTIIVEDETSLIKYIRCEFDESCVPLYSQNGKPSYLFAIKGYLNPPVGLPTAIDIYGPSKVTIGIDSTAQKKKKGS